jgi:hypothetical protein
MAGYSGTPLPKKLGIKEGAFVVIDGAPTEFESLLDPLPDGVTFTEANGGRADVVILFVERLADLNDRFPAHAQRLERGARLWVTWPKKSSGRPTDVTFEPVQRAGLDFGLVDTKVCAIDETWTGLCFMRRRA